MLEAVRNAFRLPDLRQKLLITFGILILYRFAANIPLPGVNRAIPNEAAAKAEPNNAAGNQTTASESKEVKDTNLS